MKTTTSTELFEWLLSQNDSRFFHQYLRNAEERAFGKGLAYGLLAGFLLNIIVLLWLR